MKTVNGTNSFADKYWVNWVEYVGRAENSRKQAHFTMLPNMAAGSASVFVSPNWAHVKVTGLFQFIGSANGNVMVIELPLHFVRGKRRREGGREGGGTSGKGTLTGV